MICRTLLAFCLATAAASTAFADDPVGKKLDAAKAAYQASLEKSHNAVRDWFGKREDAARKDGNKRLVDQIKAERKTYDGDGELPKGAPPDLAKSFADAHKAMEAAYGTAVKEYTQAKKDDQAAAVEKELDAYKRKRSRPNPLGVDITPEILKDKFAGKATFDDKTGTLELTYWFADRKELQDFELGDVEPRIANSAITLSAGQSIKHMVQFDTVAVVGVIGVKEMKGIFLSTTGGTTAAVGGLGKDGIYIAPKGRTALDLIVPARFRKGAIRFGVAVTEKRATLYWGTEQLGGESTEPGAGQVLLQGGDSGFGFGSIVITGKLNRAWAQKFFPAAEK